MTISSATGKLRACGRTLRTAAVTGLRAIALRVALAVLAVVCAAWVVLLLRPTSETPPHPLPEAPVAVVKPATRMDPFAAQVKLLSTALRQLRQLEDPRLALETLEPYVSRYPNGPLLAEVRAVQAEAYLELDQSAAALALLDSVEAMRLPRNAPHPHRAKLRVLRGEVLAQEGRCADAIAVFSDVALQELHLAQRALWGKAQCQHDEGKMAASRATLRELVKRFPEGDLAGRAREQLRD
ncbi:MAG: tetratricopeptide repeat protein [Myxococcaceae bacterium]